MFFLKSPSLQHAHNPNPFPLENEAFYYKYDKYGNINLRVLKLYLHDFKQVLYNFYFKRYILKP